MTFVLAALAARAPTQPSITATAVSSSSISVALTGASTVSVGKIAFYALFRSIQGAPFTLIQDISAGAFPYVDGGLPAATPVSYFAEAVNDSPNKDASRPSATATATTQSTGGTVPSTPQIAATAASSSSISIALTVPSTEPVNGIASYQLQRLEGTTYVTIATLTPTAPVANAFYVSPSGNDTNAGTLAAPFLTLAKAQAAMIASMTIKTTYVRAGTYANTSLTLLAADNGETWSYYSGDGYDSALLDGGATSTGSTGNRIFTIDGASNITINGLGMRNFGAWAVGIHGGAALPDYGFPNATAAVNNITITNNICLNGYSTLNNGWNGAVYGAGHCDNVTVTNNAIQNMYQGGVWFWPTDNTIDTSATQNNLIIKNNVVLQTCQQSPDCGAVYRQDTNVLSIGGVIANNFIRDYQGNITGGSINDSGNTLKRAVGIYLDQGASNIQIYGNVIGNTANAITTSQAIGGTCAISLNQSQNVSISGNVIDLGTTAQLCDMTYGSAATNPGNTPAQMTGNSFKGNLIIGNWSGAQASYFFGVGPVAYPANFTNPAHPTLTDNLYFNYGSGSLSTAGNSFSDAAPVTGTNPQISGAAYTIAGGSPVFGTPLNFPALVGNYGPPGYVIPPGTAPSYG